MQIKMFPRDDAQEDGNMRRKVSKYGGEKGVCRKEDQIRKAMGKGKKETDSFHKERDESSRCIEVWGR